MFYWLHDVTDSPNPSSTIATALSPSESGAPSEVTAAGAGAVDGTGVLGHGHHGQPAAAPAANTPSANNATSSTSPSATAAAAAVFGGGAAVAAAALWSKAPPTAAAAAAAAVAQFPVEVTRQLHNIYGEDFPMEARYALTGWLDAYFNEELELGNPEHEEHARRLIMNMVQQLEAKAVTEADFTSKSRLEEIVENFKVGCDATFIFLYNDTKII